jgi:hypothetical protein
MTVMFLASTPQPRYGSIMRSPGRVRSPNDMRGVIETEVQRVESIAGVKRTRRRQSDIPDFAT